MDPGDADREQLEDRVAELEQTVSKMLPDRRGVLKGLGAAAVGGAAVGGSTGGASGQSAAGQVGTESKPVDVEGAQGNFDSVNISTSITDPAGVEHTAELADIDDVGGGGGAVGLYDTDETITVGSGGDHSTINDALEAISQNITQYISEGVSVEISLLSAFVMEEQVLVSDIDLSFVVITSEDAQVTINRDDLTTEFGRRNNKCAFGGVNAGLPTLSALFDMNTSGTADEQPGINLEYCSHMVVESGGGVTNATNEGVRLADSSWFSGRGCDFSGAGGNGATVAQSSNFSAQEADFSGAGGDGIYVHSNSVVDVYNSDFSDASANGIFADRASSVNAVSATIDNAGEDGIFADGGARVDANLASIQNGGTGDGVFAQNSAEIDVNDATITGFDSGAAAGNRAGKINLRDATAQSDNGTDIRMFNGSIVNATGCETTNGTPDNSDLEITPNEVDGKGIIFVE